MKQETVDRIRRGTLPAAVAGLLGLAWLTWLPTPWGRAPDWTGAADVTAPLTRKLLFYHLASAWTAFAGYLLTFALSIAYLSERRMRDDTAARAATEVGFLMNTIALATGTMWGLQEWYKEGQNGLATVYTDPKVLVVLVMWLTFAAYLMLRRLVDSPERRARLAAAFGILGFLGVPASYLVGKVIATELHPDLTTPRASVAPYEQFIIVWSFVAFSLLLVHLFLARLRLARLEDRIEILEDSTETPYAQ